MLCYRLKEEQFWRGWSVGICMAIWPIDSGDVGVRLLWWKIDRRLYRRQCCARSLWCSEYSRNICIRIILNYRWRSVVCACLCVLCQSWNGTRQHVAFILATCIPLYTATDGQQTGNNFETFLKHFSDCLFYFCSTCADSITKKRTKLKLGCGPITSLICQCQAGVGEVTTVDRHWTTAHAPSTISLHTHTHTSGNRFACQPLPRLPKRP